MATQSQQLPNSVLPPQPVVHAATVSSVGASTHALIIVRLVCWALAVIIGLWGSMRQARRAAGARRKARVTGVDAGPTPGLTGFLDRWAVWSLALVGAGLILLLVGTFAV